MFRTLDLNDVITRFQLVFVSDVLFLGVAFLFRIDAYAMLLFVIFSLYLLWFDEFLESNFTTKYLKIFLMLTYFLERHHLLEKLHGSTTALGAHIIFYFVQA